MTRDQILAEIRRTAAANGGEPLGKQRFESETGIRRHDWYGRYWTKWSDAIREAGLPPNARSEAVPEEALLEALALLTRELGHLPTEAELRMRKRTDDQFPSHATFRRLGTKSEVARRLHTYAQTRELPDLALLCEPHLRDLAEDGLAGDEPGFGFVYLVRHGKRREFKIGRTNNRLRRHGEIAIELPEELQPLHVIETDDPPGVEAYWHRRFADKRLNGEWFGLSSDDVRAFRRWRKIL